MIKLKKIEKIMNMMGNSISDEYYVSKHYCNRELSWMEFNKRVLSQIMKPDVPLLEKVNFLGISTSNLDEFIMVRLSSIQNRLYSDGIYDISGLSAIEEYEAVLESISDFKEIQEECYDVLVDELKSEGIYICEYDELDITEQGYIANVFTNEIYPILTPINYDTTKEFPIIKSKQINIVVSVEDRHKANTKAISFIELDKSLKKLYKLPHTVDSKVIKYIRLEDIIYSQLHRLYIGKNISSYGTLKILRQNDIAVDHDNDVYIVDRMRNNIRERELSSIILMEISDSVPKPLRKILMGILGINKSNLLVSTEPYDFTAFHEIDVDRDDLRYNKFTPQYPNSLIGEHDMFTAIDRNDILLHHPYESFEPVIKLIEHAAYDKDVLCIKQTLYRVSSIDSPIIEALCDAAQLGKQVAVMLELKARFDEPQNLALIDKLKSSGCKLIYGADELKTHCKFITIVKNTKNGIKLYSHIGTGNYNDKTAKIYSDISYFTSSTKIGQGLLTIFNMLSGFSEPQEGKMKKVYYSPFNLREKLYECIDKEASLGRDGVIILKCNSLSDKGIIDRLYSAAKRGVRIVLSVRGICSMKPLYSNIRIISIVGRFLEHTRLYYFGNDDEPEVYISSADLMTRNLDNRFEILLPITNEESVARLSDIATMQCSDTDNAFQMDKRGRYTSLYSDYSDNQLNIHQYFIDKAEDKFKNVPKMKNKKKKRID